MKTMTHVVAAGAFVALATIPFLVPYLRLRALGFSPRSLAETDKFSADSYAYLTADPGLRLIGGWMQQWPKAEGALFPGFSIIALSLVALATAFREGSIVGRDRPTLAGRRFTTWLSYLLAAAGAMLVALAFGWTLRLPFFKITSFARLLWIAIAMAVVLLAISAEARETTKRWWSHPVGMLAGLTLFAIVMSLGPHIHAKGRVIADPSLYAFFYNFVPGFDGVRAPARYGMIAALGLAALAGFGVRALDSAGTNRIAAIAVLAILIESFAVPIGVNENSVVYKQPGLRTLPATLTLEPAEAETYGFVAALPAPSAIVELPLGEPAFDVRYMLYSTRHWKPLVNGYSGGAPDDYGQLDHSLQDLWTRPERAWNALVASRATHAIVHEHFYSGDRGPQVSAWFRSNGATEVGTFGSNRIFALR
jgi:hypothetical protein